MMQSELSISHRCLTLMMVAARAAVVFLNVPEVEPGTESLMKT